MLLRVTPESKVYSHKSSATTCFARSRTPTNMTEPAKRYIRVKRLREDAGDDLLVLEKRAKTNLSGSFSSLKILPEDNSLAPTTATAKRGTIRAREQADDELAIVGTHIPTGGSVTKRARLILKKVAESAKKEAPSTIIVDIDPIGKKPQSSAESDAFEYDLYEVVPAPDDASAMEGARVLEVDRLPIDEPEFWLDGEGEEDEEEKEYEDDEYKPASDYGDTDESGDYDEEDEEDGAQYYDDDDEGGYGYGAFGGDDDDDDDEE